MLVRRAREEDAPAFARVVASVAAEVRWIRTEAPVDLAVLAASIRTTVAAGEDPLWMLEHASLVVGTAGLHHTPAPGVASLGIVVVAEARGRGGGRALMQAAMDYAAHADLHKVELEVFPDNARAIALYAAHGFQVEGLRREHYRRRDGTRRDALLMARLL